MAVIADCGNIVGAKEKEAVFPSLHLHRKVFADSLTVGMIGKQSRSRFTSAVFF
jgi:hypothetical protein